MVLKIEGFVPNRLQRFQQFVLHRCQVQETRQAATRRPLEVKLHLRANRIVVKVVLPVTKKHYMQAIFAGHLRDDHSMYLTFKVQKYLGSTKEALFLGLGTKDP